MLHVTTDHAGYDKIGRQFPGFPRTDLFAVSHDSHFIGYLQDFRHFMTDVENRDASAFQIVDYSEEVIDLVFRKRGRRFIHDDDAAVVRDGFRDFNRLNHRN